VDIFTRLIWQESTLRLDATSPSVIAKPIGHDGLGAASGLPRHSSGLSRVSAAQHSPEGP
jgi:hypothetical protein